MTWIKRISAFIVLLIVVFSVVILPTFGEDFLPSFPDLPSGNGLIITPRFPYQYFAYKIDDNDWKYVSPVFVMNNDRQEITIELGTGLDYSVALHYEFSGSKYGLHITNHGSKNHTVSFYAPFGGALLYSGWSDDVRIYKDSASTVVNVPWYVEDYTVYGFDRKYEPFKIVTTRKESTRNAFYSTYLNPDTFGGMKNFEYVPTNVGAVAPVQYDSNILGDRVFGKGHLRISNITLSPHDYVSLRFTGNTVRSYNAPEPYITTSDWEEASLLGTINLQPTIIDAGDLEGDIGDFLDNSVGSFFTTPLIGPFSIGGLLLIPLAVLLVVAFLKVFAGG